MRFFFPDSQDQIDPNFDFLAEERDPFRVRQRDDLYAHEALKPAPYDGILVSKAIVDGTPGGAAGKYTAAQRNRLYSEGAEKFFRLAHSSGRLAIMGDCGAFNYHKLDVPPYTVDQVIDFYEGCGFDLGVSVDHVILDYKPTVKSSDSDAISMLARQEITMELAAEFRHRCRQRRVRFEIVGVAQGWSPASYADAVDKLQRMGYRRVALGGMVLLKTHQIIECLGAVDRVRRHDTQLHLLGISRYESAKEFAGFGVTSFDSTAPFFQAFKDETRNYHTPTRTYVAIRVPQVDGNREMRNLINSGAVSQDQAIKLERAALDLLRRYGRGEAPIDEVLQAIRDYDALRGERKDRTARYRDTLAARPWEQCPCSLCRDTGIDILVFRGTDRNKRRGFHNLYVFEQCLRESLRKESK